ncbi:hypothetical protein, partial [Nitrospira sp. BLG_2]|uniref:hypothetical protein n=1 Tax=Nitrospira sp. BLG_2 TaxID=3397507 RepID=UPI003B9BE335
MKSFSLSNAKWLIAPLITLALIGAMWSYYSLIYVPNRVEYFTGRNLRILATIGNEITSVIRNYNQVLLRTEPLEYAITHTFVRSGTGTSWAITYTPTDSGTPIKQKDVQDVIHKLVALLLCLASTSCTVATGNRDVASKAARDRIHPGMTKAEVSGI